MDLLAALPAGAEAELRALSSSKAIDARLRELGVSKLGHRLKLAGLLSTPQERAEASSSLSAVAPAAAAPAPRPRVLFVSHTGYFAPNTFGGATRASLAMLRDKPVPEAMVFKLDGGKLAELEWEGERVLIGRSEALGAAVAGRRYDAVVSLSIEASLLRFALDVPARVRYAMAHNYYLPPFGPFRRFGVADDHLSLLEAVEVLCPCQHHCEYLQRWWPRKAPSGGSSLACRPLYAADYQYFHTVPDGKGGVNLPGMMAPWQPSHRHVTMVSPSAEKGLCVLLALARKMRSTTFAAVCTGWTSAVAREVLEAEPNIVVMEANP